MRTNALVNVARSDASRMSWSMASAKPPPAAAPFTAAISGLSKFLIASVSLPIPSAVERALGRAELGCQPEFFVHQHVEPVPGRVAVEVAHVGARAERIAFACRNHHPHSVAVRASSSAARYSAEQCPGQAVALLWPVEPADQNGAVSLDHDFGSSRYPAAQRSSGSLPALTVDCSSTYSERPSAPNSRPMPDCLNPPNGR